LALILILAYAGSPCASCNDDNDNNVSYVMSNMVSVQSQIFVTITTTVS